MRVERELDKSSRGEVNWRKSKWSGFQLQDYEKTLKEKGEIPNDKDSDQT